MATRAFLSAKEAREYLNECRTVFYSPRGSRHHPDFPEPIRRPGRAPVWHIDALTQFAEHVAREARTVEPAKGSRR